MGETPREEEMRLWVQLWDLLDKLYPNGLPTGPSLFEERVVWVGHFPISRDFPAYTSRLVVKVPNGSRCYFDFDLSRGRIANGGQLEEALASVQEFAKKRKASGGGS